MNTKRPFAELRPLHETQQQLKESPAFKQPYQPRPMRPQFPPRGTAPRPMRTNAVSSYQEDNPCEIDYNCIQSLRAYAIHSQSQRYEEYEQEESQPVLGENPEDADWDPEHDL